MSNCILIISDKFERSAEYVRSVGERYPIEFVDVSEVPSSENIDPLLLVVDIDLADQKTIQDLRDAFTQVHRTKNKIFLTESSQRSAIVQARALGAKSILLPPHDDDELENCIAGLLRQMTRKKLEHRSVKESAAFQSIASLNDSIFQSIQNAESLPKKKVQMCCKIITSCLQETNIHSWLETVKEHHSYTYRHSMNVTGLAVAFAMHYGMRKADINRIATGALMHDIGKARIPLSILDKPGPLTPEEVVQVRQHPVYSGIILSEDRQFDPEVIDIAVHHHECLDGTGYPDGLKGDEISDLVRIITIVDIFSGLIDQRSYKEALPKEQAYQIMLGMKNKLDMDLLHAFETITLDKPGLATNAFPLQVA